MTTSPNPDLSPLDELVLWDRDPQELVDRALQRAGVVLPGWEPREGNTEVVLVEALAVVVAELVFALNRAPQTVAEVVAQLAGVDPDRGFPPKATATVALIDSLGHTIDAGTRVRLALTEDPTTWVTFTTDADLVVGAGDDAGVVGITGEANVEHTNGTPIGTPLELLDAILEVEAVELATAVTLGRLPETADQWALRARQRFDRLSEGLVLAPHFTAYALEQPSVVRATTLDLYDPTSGNDPGEDGGNVTVVAADVAGTPLAAGAAADLLAGLQARSRPDLLVHVLAPTLVDVDVDATVRRLPGTVAVDVEAAALVALAAFLDPDTWPWSQTVAVNDLIALLDGVAGVDVVLDVADPAADVVLDPGALPVAGVLSVTVVDP